MWDNKINRFEKYVDDMSLLSWLYQIFVRTLNNLYKHTLVDEYYAHLLTQWSTMPDSFSNGNIIQV
jgi:hypothetical protein